MNLPDAHHDTDPLDFTGGFATHPSPVDRRRLLYAEAPPPATARSRETPADASPGRRASRRARRRWRNHATGRKSSSTYISIRYSDSRTAARAEAREAGSGGCRDRWAFLPDFRRRGQAAFLPTSLPILAMPVDGRRGHVGESPPPALAHGLQCILEPGLGRARSRRGWSRPPRSSRPASSGLVV